MFWPKMPVWSPQIQLEIVLKTIQISINVTLTNIETPEYELLLLPSKFTHTRNLLWSAGAEQQTILKILTKNI